VIQIRFLFIIFLFFLFLSNNSNGQDKTYEADYHNWFDSITGIENSELHQAMVYVERHRTKGKKTKFFPEADFALGSLVFDDQPYFDLDLKYDVFDDELLMKANRQVGGRILQLYKTKVDGFSIDGHDFKQINDAQMESGFYEIALEKPLFSLYKKHKKNPIEQLGKKLIFYEFEDGKKECFLYYRQDYHAIKKVSDLTNLFPDYTAPLKSFHKNQNSKADFDVLLEGLLVHLDTLLDERMTKTIEN